ncbi:MAG: DUF6249 domain-containing protein [Phocaeicola sp.]|uniref:DUF6249 domain-containing protein n=1 Tax=Phocaeicola sp. TaxID=2773926 RepID=UPI003FA06735
MNGIVVSLNLFIIFGTFYLIIELFARRGERKMLISKLSELSPEDAKKIETPYWGVRFGKALESTKRNSVFRWGMAFLGIGLGLFIGFYLNYYYDPEDYETRSVIYMACMCVFGGLALILSYFIERKLEMKETDKKEN